MQHQACELFGKAKQASRDRAAITRSRVLVRLACLQAKQNRKVYSWAYDNYCIKENYRYWKKHLADCR